jgi:hypothetical protein
MSQNDIEQIKTWAEDYEVAPSSQVWRAVEGKLAADDLQSTVTLHKWMAIAASVVAVAALATLWMSKPTGQAVAQADYQLEQLDDANEQLYSLKTILLLRDLSYSNKKVGVLQ